MCMSCVFDEDAYRDKQLNRYLEQGEGESSNCCEADILEDSGICSECREHCVSKSEKQANYLDDISDMKYEEMRDER